MKRAAGPAVLLVSAADKLHNVRSTLQDLREHGAEVWERFSLRLDYFKGDITEEASYSRLNEQLCDECGYPGNIAYYARRAARSGRRSTGFSRSDALAQMSTGLRIRMNGGLISWSRPSGRSRVH